MVSIKKCGIKNAATFNNKLKNKQTRITKNRGLKFGKVVKNKSINKLKIHKGIKSNKFGNGGEYYSYFPSYGYSTYPSYGYSNYGSGYGYGNGGGSIQQPHSNTIIQSPSNPPPIIFTNGSLINPKNDTSNTDQDLHNEEINGIAQIVQLFFNLCGDKEVKNMKEVKDTVSAKTKQSTNLSKDDYSIKSSDRTPQPYSSSNESVTKKSKQSMRLITDDSEVIPTTVVDTDKPNKNVKIEFLPDTEPEQIALSVPVQSSATRNEMNSTPEKEEEEEEEEPKDVTCGTLEMQYILGSKNWEIFCKPIIHGGWISSTKEKNESVEDYINFLKIYASEAFKDHDEFLFINGNIDYYHSPQFMKDLRKKSAIMEGTRTGHRFLPKKAVENGIESLRPYLTEKYHECNGEYLKTLSEMIKKYIKFVDHGNTTYDVSLTSKLINMTQNDTMKPPISFKPFVSRTEMEQSPIFQQGLQKSSDTYTRGNPIFDSELRNVYKTEFGHVKKRKRVIKKNVSRHKIK